MLKKLDIYKFGTVSIGIALVIGLTFTMFVLPSNANAKIVSIVKGASNPSATEPYNPSPLSVPVGTTVTWINDDNTGHTVTQGNPSGNTPPNGFDSSILAPGKTFTHTFGTAGTIEYYCTLHPTMLGEVIVN